MFNVFDVIVYVQLNYASCVLRTIQFDRLLSYCLFLWNVL